MRLTNWAFASDCGCCGGGQPCTIAYIQIQNEAGGEDTDVALTMMGNIQSLDENNLFPEVKNKVTGLNYDTDPLGSTRVGLMDCIWMFFNGNDSTGASCSLPAPFSTWTGATWPVSPVRLTGSYQAASCGPWWNMGPTIISRIEGAFGAYQWTNQDGTVITNPHPKKIVIVIDDSGSMNWNEAGAQDTINYISTYYIDRGMSPNEMRYKTQFSMPTNCSAGLYDTPTGGLGGGDAAVTERQFVQDTSDQWGEDHKFYFYSHGHEGWYVSMYPFLRNYSQANTQP